MKKIDYSSLYLLDGGENILITIKGFGLSLWVIPRSDELRSATLKELLDLGIEYPTMDYFVVDKVKVDSPGWLGKWFCTKKKDKSFTYEVFKRSDYKTLKDSLQKNSIYKII